MKATTLIWIFTFTLTVGGLGAWRYFNPPSPAPHVAVLDDRSDSLVHDCGAIVALGQRSLKLPHIGPKSTLSLFSTTNLEPAFIASLKLPTAKLTTEGKRRQAATEKAFFDDLRKRCDGLPVQQSSPLVRSIRQVVSHLKALDGSAGVVHYLLARTDLQETSDIYTKRLLLQPVGTVMPTGSSHLIDNAGVNVIVCGYAESIPPRTGQNEYNIERINEVWPTLFTHAELLRLEPYCPKPEVQMESR